MIRLPPRPQPADIRRPQAPDLPSKPESVEPPTTPPSRSTSDTRYSVSAKSIRYARALETAVPEFADSVQRWLADNRVAGATPPPSTHSPTTPASIAARPMRVAAVRRIGADQLARVTGSESASEPLRTEPLLTRAQRQKLDERLSALNTAPAKDRLTRANELLLLATEIPPRELLRALLVERDAGRLSPLSLPSIDAAPAIGKVKARIGEFLTAAIAGQIFRHELDPRMGNFGIAMNGAGHPHGPTRQFVLRDILAPNELPTNAGVYIAKDQGALLYRAGFALTGVDKNILSAVMKDGDAYAGSVLLEYAAVSSMEARQDILGVVGDLPPEKGEKFLGLVAPATWHVLREEMAADLRRCLESIQELDPKEDQDLIELELQAIRKIMASAAPFLPIDQLVASTLDGLSKVRGPTQKPVEVRVQSARSVAAPKLLAEPRPRKLDLDTLESMYHEGWGLIAKVAHELTALGALEPNAPLPDDRFLGQLSLYLKSHLTREELTNFQPALPQAIFSILCSCEGKDGLLSPERARELFGPRAQSFVKDLERLEPAPGGFSRRKTIHRYLEDTSRLGKVVSAAQMPVLGETAKMLAKPDQFRGFRMVAVQHLFPSTGGLFESFANLGLRSSQTTIIGKPYSTDPRVVAQLQADRWSVSPFSTLAAHGASSWARQELYLNAPQSMRSRLDEIPDVDVPAAYALTLALADLRADASGDKILLLDEGGKLVKALHKYFPEYASRCVAVEQTDRGIQELEKLGDLQCPVINMARSGAKKIHEAPMIGESVAASIDSALATMNPALRFDPKEASIIGYGAVGKATAEALVRRGFRVRVFDTDPSRLEAAKADGHLPVTKEEALAKGKLLVSCTGRQTMTLADYDKLPKGAILANAASGNHELGAQDLPDDRNKTTDDPNETIDDRGLRTSTFQGKPVVLGDFTAQDEMFHRVLRGKDGSERLLLRSGYVVNMEEDIPPAHAQLIRGLLLASCIQASKSTTPGLTELDPVAQHFIVSRTERHLKAAGQSLHTPNFSAPH